MKTTLKVNNFENYLLWFAASKGRVPGTSLDDLDNMVALRKLFVSPAFEGERDVEVSVDLMRYLRAAWAGLPVGELARTDDLSDTVKAVTAKLKE